MMLLAAALFASLPLTPAEPAAPAADEPIGNILVLLLDDIGVDGLAAYGLGSDLPNTPNIDALAAKGVVFRNAWSNPVCSPTRATIQTGRYCFRTGVGYTVTEYNQEMALAEVTIPEMLKLSGVDMATGAFGKWHLANQNNGGPFGPNLAGYDTYRGALINFHPPQNYYNYFKTNNGISYASTTYATTDEVNEARNWINAQTKPWFAYVAFHAPHTPIHAPPANLHSVDLSTAGSPKEDPRPYWKAMVEAVDTEIGRLFNQIAIDFNQTTVILLGDNGTVPLAIVPPFNPAHGKGTAFEGGINVPLIVAGPDVKDPGFSRALVNTTDVFATVSDLTRAGYVPPPGEPRDGGASANTLDSVSFRPFLKNKNAPSIREFLWAEMFFPTKSPAIILRRAIRDKRYKLITRMLPATGTVMQMYDLFEDPFERNDLLKSASLTPIQQEAYDRLTAESAKILASQ